MVAVAALGFAPSAEKSVTVAASPEDPARADFVLDTGGSLRGSVVDAESKEPIEGARVSVEATMREGPAAPVSSTLTDEQGQFDLRGIAPGKFSVLVAASGHHGRIVSGVEVGDDGTAGPIVVSLTPTKEGEEPRLELAGIGVVLAAKDDKLVIGQVIEGGGGAEAGLRPGDAIVAVEGRNVGELGFQGSIEAIRGPEGSVVRLTVVKEQGEPTEISVQRKKIRT